MNSMTTTRQTTKMRDLTYGHGGVAWSGPARHMRALTMDVYIPSGESAQPRAGLVMAFGGAFHRGSKENDSFEAEAANTPVSEYCDRLARMGYVCFSIDYRLVTEDPDPGPTPVILAADSIPTSRVDVVRRLMGLPPITSEQLWRGIEAASDDMATAVRFIRASAQQWNLDPDRLAVGGFSAGARTALNAAIGEKVPVAAVISLSGYMDLDDLSAHLAASDQLPPVLLVHAEHDLEYVAQGTLPLATALRQAGVSCERVHVPSSGHFYRADALAQYESRGQMSVEQAICAFLEDHL